MPGGPERSGKTGIRACTASTSGSQTGQTECTNGSSLSGMGSGQQEDLAMSRITSRSWTTEQIECLRTLVDRGISPARASVVLKRPILAVQSKARELGTPFADTRKTRAARLAREAVARRAIEQSTLTKAPSPAPPLRSAGDR